MNGNGNLGKAIDVVKQPLKITIGHMIVVAIFLVSAVWGLAEYRHLVNDTLESLQITDAVIFCQLDEIGKKLDLDNHADNKCWQIITDYTKGKKEGKI